VDAIVFDWDGTLVDTLPLIFEANRRVLEEIGLPFDDDRYRAVYVPDWRLMYQRLGVPDDALDTVGARWLELYGVAEGADILPGAADALRRLAGAGFVMGLVTAGDRDIVEDQLTRFGLADLLPVRICGTDGLAAKPHPEPLLRALADLGATERRVHARYVGDVPDDMRMARAVGARGIGIESAIGTREDLLEAGATEVHASVAAWVEGLLARSPDEPGVTPEHA
jgi:HAD superfamily hydrolase (TIGR01549 family)